MKRIDLDQMKNMSIDNLIELYRDGYRLEEHTPITSLSNIPNFSNIHTLQGPLLDPVVNFGKVTVSTGYDAAATSIILNTNEGSKLPDPSSGAFNLVWWNSTDYPDPSDDPNKEIVRCTAKTTDTLTVARPQEGTSASIKNLVGKTYKMIITPTAKMISDISSAITARVVKSGDTMTGTLNLPTNGLIVGTNQLIVSGGNVGIGTTVPRSKLEVASGSANTNADPAGIVANFTGPTQSVQGSSISLESNDAVATDTGGILGFGGRYSTTQYANWASIKGLKADATSGNYGGYLSFFTRLTGATIAERMRIDTNGNVGIGTTNPGYRGDINGSFRVQGTAQGGASSGKGLEIHPGASLIQIYGWNRDGSGGIPISFQEAGSEKVIFYGNVGIGITSPTAKLHIGGTAGVDGIKFPDGTLQTTAATSIPVGSYSPQINTTSTSYVKLLNFKFISAFTGNITMSWEMSRDTANQCYAKIYKNGVAIGTEKSLTATTTWEIKSDTVSVTMAVNDVLELWGYRVTNSTLSVRNILLGNVVLAYL